MVKDLVEGSVRLIYARCSSGETTVKNREEETPDGRYVGVSESGNHHQWRMMAHVIEHVQKHNGGHIIGFFRDREFEHGAEVFFSESELPSVKIELESPVVLVEVGFVHHLTHSCLWDGQCLQ